VLEVEPCEAAGKKWLSRCRLSLPSKNITTTRANQRKEAHGDEEEKSTRA